MAKTTSTIASKRFMTMPNYILITEAALDQCLINSGFSPDFHPKEDQDVHKVPLSEEITGYRNTNEPPSPYFALINQSCLEDLKKTANNPNDAYRRIARVVKGLKSPPIHLPRQWSEYHYKNLIAFFALPKGSSARRWIADLEGNINGVRFDTLTSSGEVVDLSTHKPTPWPENIQANLAILASKKFEQKNKATSSAFATEIDLKAIGSASVVGNRTYEEWETFLTPSQKEVLKHPIGASIRIVGPAGSGKTLALCLRAVKIARDPEVSAKGKKVLIATHSWAMAERIDGVLSVLNAGNPVPGITIFPLLSLLEMHAGHIGQQRTDVIGDDSSDGRLKAINIINDLLRDLDQTRKLSVSPWIQEGLQASDGSRPRLDLSLNLYDEISGVLAASGVAPDDPDSIRDYINGKRDDSMPPFTSVADRVFVIAVYRDFIQELIDRSSITTDQFVLDSIRVLETFTWRMRKETDGYDYILIDELQLFDPQERSALELLGRSRKGVPFITAEDPTQGVFSALNSRNASKSNQLVYLDTVHRFNKEIFDLISYIYQKFPLNTLPLKIEKPRELSATLPRLFTCSTDGAAVACAADLANTINESASPTDRICIATLGDVDIQLAEILEQKRLIVTRLASFDDVEQLAYSKRSIIVAPWQFVGGTQFSHVIVLAAAISQPHSQFGKLRELISVYLSCSRATQSLTIVCSDYTPAVLADAKQQLLIESISKHD